MSVFYFLRFRVLVYITDLALLNISFALALILHLKVPILHVSDYLHYFLAINMIWAFSVGINRTYIDWVFEKLEYIYRKTFYTISMHMVGMVIFLYFIGDAGLPKFTLLLFYIFLVSFFLLTRFIMAIYDHRIGKKANLKVSAAVFGHSNTSAKIADYLSNDPITYEFTEYIGQYEHYNDLLKDEYITDVKNAIKEVSQKHVKELFVPFPVEKIHLLRDLLIESEKDLVKLRLIPVISENVTQGFINLKYMAGMPVISIRKDPLDNESRKEHKRIFDILFSSLVILLIMSWLYPLIALIIKLTSKGPVLFKQERSGKDNESFMCYKFRTMKMNKDSDKKQATKDDDRITPIGKFLRKSSLDEFPQFFNVFKGDMSIVGPRPHMIKHTEEYRAIINKYMVRHYIKPGITGWAQVNGFRGNTSNNYYMRKRVEFDIWYMENWSLMLDIKIIFLTVFNIFKGEKNAY
ncbi:MAG: undecaprenyl-phosphate glucose phosphotransferase [Cytophagales bacterium]